MFRLPWYAPRDGAPAEAAPPGRVRGLPAAARRGRGDRRHRAVPLLGRRVDRPRVRLGPVRQPVEPGPLRGRLVGRVGGGGRRAPRGRRGRHRRRRQRAPARRLLRRHRHEGDLRRDRDGRLHARLLGHGRDRADLPRRGRRAHLRRGADGTRADARRRTAAAGRCRPRPVVDEPRPRDRARMRRRARRRGLGARRALARGRRAPAGGSARLPDDPEPADAAAGGDRGGGARPARADEVRAPDDAP